MSQPILQINFDEIRGHRSGIGTQKATTEFVAAFVSMIHAAQLSSDVYR
jgi:hypothetical protein